MERLDRQQELKAVLDAVWDFRSPFDQMLGHAAAVAREMADNDGFSGTTLASFIGQWFVKAAMKADAPSSPIQVLVDVTIAAATRQNLSPIAAGKLWQAYRLLIEFHHGNSMDERKEAEAINLVGRKCASIYKQNAVVGATLHSSLRRGLTAGTSDEDNFTRGYTQALQQLAISATR